MTPHQALQQYFGYPDFRHPQLDIITAVLAGNNVLAVLPTGAGKSLCYQIPGLLLPGITLVISPLISLMKDQVDQLSKRHIPATYLNSSLSPHELQRRVAGIANDAYRFMYVAPERISQAEFQTLIKTKKVSLIAIDEAHCISEWGHDFRPQYRQIQAFLSSLKDRPPVIAVTASATPHTQRDIIDQLGMKKHHFFSSSIFRPNLQLVIKNVHSHFSQRLVLMRLLLKHHHQPCIVYCVTREKTEYTAKLINTLSHGNISVAAYHAGLTASDRSQLQDDFIANKINVICATSAFGMGVDKPNIRSIIHLNLPNTLEQYYQEVGRAGRDGLASTCYTLWYEDDLVINKQLLDSTKRYTNSAVHHKQVEAKFNSLLGFIHQQKKICRFSQLATYFGENESLRCQHCDQCQKYSLDYLEHEKANIELLDQVQKQYLSTQIKHWIALLAPQTKDELVTIPGVGNGWLDEVMPKIRPSLDHLHLPKTGI